MTRRSPSYRTNQNLFSNHYLSNHLRETDAWNEPPEEEVREAYEEIRALYEKRADRVADYNESQLERRFVRPLFEILGIPFEVEETVQRVNRRPDYGFFESERAADAAFDRDDFYEEAIAVADAKFWDRKLDTRGEKRRDFENPSYQIHVYLEETPTSWAVLTNGRKWRLYYGPTSHRLDSYYEVDLPDLLAHVAAGDGDVAAADREGEGEETPAEVAGDDTAGSLEDFREFYLFFRREAFVADTTGDCFLDDVYEESNRFSEELGEDLQENIYEAIRVLAAGFLDRHDDLGASELDLIHDSSLIYLYRLIFVLYAESEERALLPTDNPIYESDYSLNSRKETVAERLDATGETYHAWQTDLWDQLEKLFELIDRGSRAMGIPADELQIPAYNGGLFRTDVSGDAGAEARFLAEHEVGDEYLAAVIDLLSRHETDTSGGKTFVDYSSLDVRHLGSIYEGLLEYELNLADEPKTVTDDGEYETAGEGDEVVVAAGEVYLTTDSGERKATGSYYTPEYVVEYIVEETLGPQIEEIRAELLSADLDSDDEGGFAERFTEKVLELRVLDPAMGSGHFLVNAVDYLAREIIDAREQQDRQAVDEGRESEITVTTEDGEQRDINWARRQVAKQCLYGVDLNPLATELAKVSLWLRTLAAGKPLAFLDHHLKTGNSLVGSNIYDVLSEDDPDEGQLTLMQSLARVRDDTLSHVRDLMDELVSIENDDLASIKEMEATYAEIRADPLYRRLIELANVHTAERFGLDVPDDAYETMAGAIESESDWQSDVAETDWFVSAQAMAEDELFFHWELEFPEVFLAGDDSADVDSGFDVVVANPPYIRIQELRTNTPSQAEYYLDRYESSTENFDVYATFTERAYELINSGGFVGHIQPHKFFQAEFGKGLRKYLSRNDALNKVVSFGHEQVFENASVYTCILILSKGGVRGLDYAETTPEKLQSAVPEFNRINPGIDDSPWSFQPPEEKAIIGKIESKRKSLESATKKIYQGVITSADDVYLVRIESERDETTHVVNGFGETWEVETELLYPFLKGEDIDRYSPPDPPNQVILPYETSGDQPEFIPEDRLERAYPHAYEYFSEYEESLRARDSGGMDHEKWYDFTRAQNMDEFLHRKLVTPDISYGGNFTVDTDGMFHKSAVYGVIAQDWISENYLLSLLNSSLLWFYLQGTGNILRGGYFRFKTDYLEPFGVPRAKDVTSLPKELTQRVEQTAGKSGDSVPDTLARIAETQLQTHRKLGELNVSLPDYLGTYSDGDTLADVGFTQPPRNTAGSILQQTTEQRPNLRVGRAVVTRESATTVEIALTARYKPDNPAEYETDQWDYTETDPIPALRITDLTETEADLIEAFVPYAVDEADGFAEFRDNATKTNSLVDRLRELTLPRVADVEQGLDSYVQARERAAELESKIERTDELIDEIVYELYGLTDDEIEIVEESVGDD